MTAKLIISIAYIGAVATPYRRNSDTLSTMYTLLASIMVRCVQNQSFLLIVAASTKLRIFSNPLASLYDGIRIEVSPIQTWKLHPMNVPAIHVAELCRIIHPRCIRNRYSPLRDHLAQRIQPLVLKVPDTVALKWSDFVQLCAERIYIFIYFIGVSRRAIRSHIMRKALQFLAPLVFYQPLCCFIFCTLWENKLLIITQTSWQVIFPLI